MATNRKPASITRRNFLGHALLASASSALIQASGLLGVKGWLSDARAATADLTVDTFNGLLAFVVPGSDPYSTAQGVSTPELATTKMMTLTIPKLEISFVRVLRSSNPPRTPVLTVFATFDIASSLLSDRALKCVNFRLLHPC